MYTVLARKYRPAKFDEVCGQQHITRVLQKAIKESKVAHAYLFSGPRGTGKTSIARIFAKALNCEKNLDGEPCQECDMCKSISAGTSIDILEIDGASNRGIEEIRVLRENVNLMPAEAPFKIYIIDEVHMLTPDASNALLKTLEEPPFYVKFFLATTAPEKIIPTILSRCQRFNFRPLTKEEVLFQLKKICGIEKIKVDEEALNIVFEFSGGSLRDALSMLDQLIVNSKENHITCEDTREFLGIMEDEAIIEFLLCLRRKDIKNSVLLFHNLLSEGKDPALILDGLVKKIKFLVLAAVGQEDSKSPEDTKLAEEFKNISMESLLEAATTILEYKDKMRFSSLPIVIIEVLLFKLSQIIGDGKPVSQKVSAEKELFEKQAKKEEKKVVPKKKEAIKEPEETTAGLKEETVEEKVEISKKIGNISELVSQWDYVLDCIKDKKLTLAAALREGVPEGQGEDSITISFKPKYSFHKSRVESAVNKKIIEKTLLEIMGKELKVEFHLEESSKNTIMDSAEVKKIIELFNGEVVKLEE